MVKPFLAVFSSAYGIRRLRRLATHELRSSIGHMIAPSGRATFVLIALGILCSGPVAACVCPDEPVHAMPCCPDDVGSPDQSRHDQPDSMSAADCAPQSADLLVVGSQDVPPPVGISGGAPPPRLTHDPPPTRVLAVQQPYDSPPIYLVTLRLRT
jgi:hypothetical protein